MLQLRPDIVLKIKDGNLLVYTSTFSLNTCTAYGLNEFDSPSFCENFKNYLYINDREMQQVYAFISGVVFDPVKEYEDEFNTSCYQQY